jgi:hypothetical protein
MGNSKVGEWITWQSFFIPRNEHDCCIKRMKINHCPTSASPDPKSLAAFDPGDAQRPFAAVKITYHLKVPILNIESQINLIKMPGC